MYSPFTKVTCTLTFLLPLAGGISKLSQALSSGLQSSFCPRSNLSRISHMLQFSSWRLSWHCLKSLTDPVVLKIQISLWLLVSLWLEVSNETWPFSSSSSSLIITDFSNCIKSLKIRWNFCIMLILSFFSSKLQTASAVLPWVLSRHCIGCLPLNILIYFLIFSLVLQLFEYTFLAFLLQTAFYKTQNET